MTLTDVDMSRGNKKLKPEIAGRFYGIVFEA